MSFRPTLLLLLLLPAAAPAASELYRCRGADGSTAYSSSREGYQGCELIGRFPGAGTAAAKADAAPAQGVDFRTATGDATPVAPAAPKSAKVTRGAVYRYVEGGVVHYTNRKPAGGHDAKVLFTYIETCFACGARPGLDWNSVALNTGAFAREVAAAARAHGVDEALLRAMIHAESAFDANALSHKGAQGLMQLMPATAERFAVADPFAPAQNIDGGARYLAWLLRRFDGDVTLASAAYNAGEGAVDRYAGVPPYDETQRYVERVGILAKRYRGALDGVARAAGSP